MSECLPIWECYKLSGSSNPDDWRKALEQCLSRASSPYRYDIHNTSLRIWNLQQPEIRIPNSKYICRNGYELQRVTFGQAKNETLVGITLTRLAFESGTKSPTFFSTDELFAKGKYPEVLRHQPMISDIALLVEFLNQSLVGRCLERHKNYTVAHHSSNILYRFGDSSYPLDQIVQRPGLPKNLLNAVKSSRCAVPASVRLGVLSSNVRAVEVAIRISDEVARVLQTWRCSTIVEDLKNGESIDAFLNDFSLGQPVILIPLDGKKGDRPHDSAIDWMKYLNELI